MTEQEAPASKSALGSGPTYNNNSLILGLDLDTEYHSTLTVAAC